MDIKAPARVAATEPVKAPPPEADSGMPESIDLKKRDQKPVKPSKPPKPPRPHGSSTALAITATIIIVLGLGALFVYAYLRSQNAPLF